MSYGYRGMPLAHKRAILRWMRTRMDTYQMLLAQMARMPRSVHVTPTIEQMHWLRQLISWLGGEITNLEASIHAATLSATSKPDHARTDITATRGPRRGNRGLANGDFTGDTRQA